jgi:hypothetical protein
MRVSRKAIIFLFIFVNVFSFSLATAQARHYDAEEERFLQLINDYRGQHGLAFLQASDTLAEAAARHSLDMGNYSFFDHTTRKSSYFPVGSAPWDRMRLLGYPTNAAMAENIAVGQRTAQQVFEAWRNSSGHRANMLNGRFRVIGIGRRAASTSSQTYYWTTNFGSVVDSSAHTKLNADADPFTDVRPSDPELWEAAWHAKRQGYFEGYPSGSLGAWQHMTRRHVALVLARANLGSRAEWLDDHRPATRGEVMTAFPGLRWNSERLEEATMRSQLVRLLYRAR